MTIFGIVAGTGSMAAAQAAEPPETYEYRIQPGDTCAAIAERLFGNKRRWDLIHKHNPDMGPAPHRLVPGQVLILPRLEQGPDARLTDVERTVQARAPQNPDWERARRGKELYRGWRVNTLERASADVTFQDGSLVQMRQNTLIIIYGGVYRDARRKTTEASLERGTLRSRLSEFRLEVKTPTAQAGLDGGSSVLSVDDQGTSFLSNHDGGEAQFKVATGEAVRVKPGFGSKARKGIPRPTKPKPLPPTPNWNSDLDLTFPGIRAEGGTVRGAWSPVEAATSYRVEIAKDREGGEVVVATLVPSSVTSFEIHRLPEGVYFARVSSIDGEGFESPQSSAHAMNVHLVHLELPGQDADESTVATPGDASDAPLPARVLPGTKVIAPTGFRCGTGSQDEARAFELADAGVHEVRCVSDEGEAVPPIEVAVVAPVLKLLEPEAKVPLVQGQDPWRVAVAVQSELPLPDAARLRAPNGFTLDEVSTSGNATTMDLGATKESPDALALALVVGPANDETVLATLQIDLIESERLDFAPNEALGLMLTPNVLALTNDRREGSGPFATIAYLGDPKSDNGKWRLSLGAEIAPVRRARIGIAIPVDVHRSGVSPVPVRDEGILVWGGYRIFMRRDFSLYTELGVWFPSVGDSEAVVRTRFAPAIEGSYLLVDRLLFRSRQGAILETSSGGPFLWASAYGIDIKLVRLLSISAELDVVLGKSGGDAVTGVGGGPGLSVLAGPAAIYFATRFAATDDFRASNGKYTFSGGLRLTFE
ncbi:MAG: LysM peptidoglycan-binding domain-containing protein [Myxococcales bacterium]|nr:LysM peptidoglycan-binding domain-containing protein [Myxococcales bacterium]